jgi:hypothetical protein
MTNGIGTPTCVGGPYCGAPVVVVNNAVWNYFICDEPRNAVHLYERRAPTDRNFYYQGRRILFVDRPEESV